MIRGAFIALLVVSAGWSYTSAFSYAATDRPQEQQPKENPQPKTEPKLVALTGCVDEQEGEWVLVNHQTMAILANLAAEGFPTEGFAKYMGHKVTVRGTSSPGQDKRPVFKVRSIETISDTCAAR